jgi:hypothetical protein
MLILMTTRFNTKTWNERERWIENNSWGGAIYGTPIRVNSKRVGTMVVLEMHNTENKVKAIGLVKTQAWPTDKVHQIYGDRNYNRYIYKSSYRLILDQIELLPMEKKIIAIFNELLFKGACHLKRGQGIMAVPDWIMKNKQVDFLNYFKELFGRHYKQSNDMKHGDDITHGEHILSI